MKDTTLIKDKDLAYEVYLVSKKYFIVTDILCVDCKLIVICHSLLFYFWETSEHSWSLQNQLSHFSQNFTMFYL
jgi:hypothetical protein